jgi:hypothetical protein
VSALIRFIGGLWVVVCCAGIAAWLILNLQPIVQMPPFLWWLTTGWGALVLVIVSIPGWWFVRIGFRARRARRAAAKAKTAAAKANRDAH